MIIQLLERVKEDERVEFSVGERYRVTVGFSQEHLESLIQELIALDAPLEMLSNAAISLAMCKASNAGPQLPSPSQSQAPPSIGLDGASQRRNGSSGNSGRIAMSAARNNQSSRKQHKTQRRPRLVDEDAAAESVGACTISFVITITKELTLHTRRQR